MKEQIFHSKVKLEAIKKITALDQEAPQEVAWDQQVIINKMVVF
jgi:hypothetical protein